MRGHKTAGLYSMWALRNEVDCASAVPNFSPKIKKHQLRLEDLLGFSAKPYYAQTPYFF